MAGRAATGARAADDEAADLDREQPPGGIDLEPEVELASSRPTRRPRSGRGTTRLSERLVRDFRLLDLIVFFTAGDKETRAWTPPRGGTALDAAATVHLTLRSGFIRAEVLRWDDLVTAVAHTRRPLVPAASSVSKERPTRSRTATS